MEQFLLTPGKLYPATAFCEVAVPLIENPISCGFPSPAQDYLEIPIDLNDILIRNKESTFLFITEGQSMQNRNIPDGALLVVDRSVTPKQRHIVLASVNGEFTVKELDLNLMRLMPANPAFEPIVMQEGMELQIFGVITKIIVDPYLPYVRVSRL